MPRTGGRQTHDLLVHHAARLFRLHGYSKTGVRSILDAAGVSRGAFYFHFRSKRDLGEAVVGYYRKTLPLTFDQIFASGLWSDCVEQCVREFMGTAQEPLRVAAPLAHLGIEFAGSDPYLLGRVAGVMRTVEERLGEALRKRGLPAALSRRRAATVMACFEGHVLRNTLYRNVKCIAQARHDLTALGPGFKEYDPGTLEVPAAGDTDIEARLEEIAKKRLDSIDKRSIMLLRDDGADRYEAKRKDILAHAVRLFLKRGYHATGISDVAAAASAPKGSFHYYFENKRSLALEVLGCLRSRTTEGLDVVFSAGSWPAAAKAFCRMLELNAGGGALDAFPMARMGLEFAGSDERLAEEVRDMLYAAENAFAQAFRRYRMADETSADDLAGLAVALWQGHLARMVIYQDHGVLDELSEDLVTVVA